MPVHSQPTSALYSQVNSGIQQLIAQGTPDPEEPSKSRREPVTCIIALPAMITHLVLIIVARVSRTATTAGSVTYERNPV